MFLLRHVKLLTCNCFSRCLPSVDMLALCAAHVTRCMCEKGAFSGGFAAAKRFFLSFGFAVISSEARNLPKQTIICLHFAKHTCFLFFIPKVTFENKVFDSNPLLAPMDCHSK